MENLQLTAVFEEAEEGGYIAYIAEMDGVNTQGETIEEAKDNLLDAFNLMMECRQEDLQAQTNVVTVPFMSLLRSTNEKTQAH